MIKNAWTRSGATHHSADRPIVFMASEKNDLNFGARHTKTGNSGQVLPTKHSQSKSTPSRRFNNSFMDETDLANTPVAMCLRSVEHQRFLFTTCLCGIEQIS